ncbi:flagellar assembly protein FliH [Methylobacterium sp. WL18]|nr:flagellar assembly protein FliH [Methylobacterium sp. WL18]
MARRLTLSVERFPIAGAFTISRGSRTEIAVVVATITDANGIGRGECVPYPRYGESVESVVALIEGQADAIGAGIGRDELTARMKAGAARNALDCALFDLEAKLQGRRAWEIAGLTAPAPAVTAYTLSLGTPESMGEAARAALQHLRGVPHLVVRVHDGLVEEAETLVKRLARERGYEGRLVVLGDPDMHAGDARIEWADGGIVRERARIEAAVADALGLPPTP